MKLTLEISNETIIQCLNGAHSAYWAKRDSLEVNHNKVRIYGCVTENYDGQNQTHLLDVKRGLELLSAYSPKRFSELMAGDYDGETGDVFLQLCAGLTVVIDGKLACKYG